MKSKQLRAKKSTSSKRNRKPSFFSSKQPGQGTPFFYAQPKIKVGTPKSRFEVEADLMADRVVHQQPIGTGPRVGTLSNRVQRKEEPGSEMLFRQEEEEEELMLKAETEALQRQPLEEEEELLMPRLEDRRVQRQAEEEEEELMLKAETEVLQRQPLEEEEELLMPKSEDQKVQRQAEEEEELQTRLAPGVTARQDTDIATQLEQQRGRGEPLPESVRARMDNAFNADFSQIRIHTDNEAVRLNRALGAQAFTHGQDIYFNRGNFDPDTTRGMHLLAHELAHTIQQGVAEQQPEPTVSDPDSALSTPVSNIDNAENPAETMPVSSASETAQLPETPEVTVPNEPPTSKAESAISTPEAPTAEAPVAEGAPTALAVEPLMPPPPETLNPAAEERLQQARGNVRRAADNNADVPAADQQTQQAREAVTEPREETEARASGELTEELSTRPAPSPEIEELCDNIRRVIREKRPPDEDSLLQADPEAAANEAGTQINDNIEGDVERVEGEYDELEDNPTGTPEQVGQAIDTPPERVDTPEINAAGAAPDPLAEEDVSLEEDAAASAQRMEEAGMNTAPAQEVQEGPIAEARETQSELEETAAEDPAVVLAEQETALSNARADMEQLQAQALEALQQSRSHTVTGSRTQQTAMVGSEEQQRAELGRQAEAIFTNAQDRVNTLLEPLVDTGMEMWETGKARIATEFEQHLARVQAWIDDRHSGFGGGVVELWDDLTGLPDWVTDEYDAAERRFGDSICALIREISVYVNGVILTCEEIIDNANREIDELFDSVPEELRVWAEEQRGVFQERLEGLREQVSTTQQNFNQDLANRAAEAVQEVRERVHALREKAKGLLGRIADALMEFLEDPARAIINGLLSLVGIEPSSFWALIDRIGQVIEDIANDPLGFASNLLEAIGAGFQRFFDNVLSHLLEGFIEWLFAGLGAAGITIPSDFSLKSIITFFLELMGITWERIRALLARHIGEENVAWIEQAFELISDLIAMGPVGIFEMLKDQLDPREILNSVIEMAVDFVVETLIKQATLRIIALFNPVGAIVQAIEAIYRVLEWIFENAARIFSLVETVVNGIADIIAGNIAGMAAAVESALTRLLVPVIDFIAGFMGLGDLPDKVADMIRSLQDWVEGILDRVIGWLADRARSILEALGLSGDGEEGELEDREVGESVGFSGGEEQHRMWVRVTGGRVELMVASDNPMPLSQRLDQWQRAIGDLPQSEQSRARSLIDAVRGQYNVVINEGEQSQAAMEEAQRDPTPENITEAQREDDQVEQQQRSMTPELGQLFDLFEGGVPFEPVTRSVTIGAGRLGLRIDKGSNDNLEIQLEGRDVDRQIGVIESGPIGTAHHRHGLTLLNKVGEGLEPVVDEVYGVKITEGKIPSAAHQKLATWMQSIVGQVERLSPMNGRSFTHLSSPPPTPMERYTVEFGQHLGTSSTIINEYDRQLRLQQEGINALSVDQWILNRNAYSLDDTTFLALDAEQRRVVLNELKARADRARERARRRKQRYLDAIEEIGTALQPDNLEDETYVPDFSEISLVTNRFGNESSWRRKRRSEINSILQSLRGEADDWESVFQKAAVLHNSDQIAGGFGQIPDVERIPRPAEGASDEAWAAYLEELSQYVGSSNVNSSIGSLWRTNIVELESHVRENHQPEGWAIWKMNVTLTRA